MAKEKAPWFPFDAVAFLADSNQAAMTLEEAGAYVRLLAWSWREGALPSSPGRLARLLGVSTKKWQAMWPALAPCWDVHEDGTMTNPRLEAERTRKDEVCEQRSLAGGKGAAARWQKPFDCDGKAITTEKQTDAHARVLCALSSVRSRSPEGEPEREPPSKLPDVGALWDRWCEIAAQHGAKQPLVAGPGNFEHLRVLAESYASEELDRAMVAWWASPFTGGRNLGLFRSQVGEVLEHLARNDGSTYRSPRRPVEVAKAAEPSLAEQIAAQSERLAKRFGVTA